MDASDLGLRTPYDLSYKIAMPEAKFPFLEV